MSLLLFVSRQREADEELYKTPFFLHKSRGTLRTKCRKWASEDPVVKWYINDTKWYKNDTKWYKMIQNEGLGSRKSCVLSLQTTPVEKQRETDEELYKTQFFIHKSRGTLRTKCRKWASEDPVVKWYINDTKWYKMIQNDTKWYKMIQNDIKWGARLT